MEAQGLYFHVPQISIVGSNESEKHKLEINFGEKYRYWGSQNIFHLNHRDISWQKKVIFNGTIFFMHFSAVASLRGLVIRQINVPNFQKQKQTHKKNLKFIFKVVSCEL